MIYVTSDIHGRMECLKKLLEYVSFYDDEDTREKKIKVCPYNQDQVVRFGIDTTDVGKGYFIVKRNTPVREGDQLKFRGHTYSILEVHDCWLWNKVANIILVVK